jgi:uncharacterized protein involved in outer membrane biogenesis
MKKFFKWTGITILVLFILLLIAPFLFKGQIEDAIKKAANDNINGKVNWSGVSLSLIRNFPNLRVTIDDLTVDNIAPFDSVRLAQIGSLEAVVDISSLFGDEISVKKIGIVNPIFDVRVTPEGVANYDIAKADTSAVVEPSAPAEASSFKMKLKEYFIKNGKISYDDQTMPMVMRFEGLNHDGSPATLRKMFLNSSHTRQRIKATFWFDGTTYLNEVKTDLQADLSKWI